MKQASKANTDEVYEEIVTGVAALKGTDPLELPPLYDFIDPDALEALFASTNNTSRVGQVKFPYAGHEITIKFDGESSVTIS